MPHAHSPSTIHCASLNLWTAHGVCLLLLRAYLAMKIFMHTPQIIKRVKTDFPQAGESNYLIINLIFIVLSQVFSDGTKKSGIGVPSYRKFELIPNFTMYNITFMEI